MSGPKLERAKLIVLKGQSARVKGSQEIVFDFNPATLQVKVNTELEKPGKGHPVGAIAKLHNAVISVKNDLTAGAIRGCTIGPRRGRATDGDRESG